MCQSGENGEEIPNTQNVPEEVEANEEPGSYPKDLSYGVYDCDPSSVDPNGTIISGIEQKPRIVLMGLRRYNKNAAIKHIHTVRVKGIFNLNDRYWVLGVGKVPYKKSFSTKCHPMRLYFWSQQIKWSKKTFPILPLSSFIFGISPDRSTFLTPHLIRRIFSVGVAR